MVNLTEIEVEGYKLTIYYDMDSSYIYDELWQGVAFISNHRGYDSKGDNDGVTIEDIISGDTPSGLVTVPITAYIHGGIALTASEAAGYPFTDQFDSGLFGFLVFKKDEFGPNNAGVEGFVNSWQGLLNGEVFGYILESVKKCECCNQSVVETLDSCWGFYGYPDHAAMLNDMVDSLDIDADIIAKFKEKTI